MNSLTNWRVLCRAATSWCFFLGGRGEMVVTCCCATIFGGEWLYCNLLYLTIEHAFENFVVGISRVAGLVSYELPIWNGSKNWITILAHKKWDGRECTNSRGNSDLKLLEKCIPSAFLKSTSKISTHVLSTLRKHATWFVRKSFGVCRGNTLLRPPVTGRQVTEFLLGRLRPFRRT